ncbi:MAG: cell division protein SepF [Candidatus Nanoarchaeia archaeon]
MAGLFSMKKFTKKGYDEDESLEAEDEYVELNTDGARGGSSKVIVRPFVLEDFADIKGVLDALRDGNTVCLVNIKPLKEKDMVELKRAINKLKKTIEAVSGDIAGFGEEYIVVVPSFAEIYKAAENSKAVKSQGGKSAMDDDLE